MPQKIDRKKFLQLALLSPLAIAGKPLDFFAIKKPVGKNGLTTSENVSY
jgi:hypothetical protein